MHRSLSLELRKARTAFETLGRIPYDIAMKLMALGIMVQALEDQWMRQST